MACPGQMIAHHQVLRALMGCRKHDKDLARYVAAASCLSKGEDRPCRALVNELRTHCEATYFADSAVVGFFAEWSREHSEHKPWSQQVAAAFKRCQEENEKAEKRKAKQGR